MDKIRHLLIRLLCLKDAYPDASIMQQARELESLARQIRGNGVEIPLTDDLSSILVNVKEMLQPLVEDVKRKSLMGHGTDANELIAATELPIKLAVEDKTSQPERTIAKEIRILEKEKEPSRFALEIIRLRDWVLTSRDGGGSEQTQRVLEALYVMLGQALTLEDITEYDAKEGVFDPYWQQAVMSASAPEPAMKNSIHASIRPGYLFGEKILRQQQVSIFV